MSRALLTGARATGTAACIVLLGAVTVLVSSSPARAAPGDLDPKFSRDGKVRTTIPGFHVVDAIGQPDRKAVTIGTDQEPYEFGHRPPQAVLTRYRNHGKVDASFGGNGSSAAQIGAEAAALQPDGKIVLAGWVEEGRDRDVALARFLPDGSVDESFGDNGTVTTDFALGEGDSIESWATDVAVQPDGRIVVVGRGTRSLLARYLPDGRLDSKFSGNGFVLEPPDESFGYAALALEADGHLLAGGSDPSWKIARYTAAGTLDRSFAEDGIARYPGQTEFVAPADLALQRDGKIIVVGVDCLTVYPAVCQLVLLRYQPDGDVDASFADQGVQVPKILLGAIAGLAVQPNGKILVGFGYETDPTFVSAEKIGFVRFTSDGAFDHVFSADGIAVARLTDQFGGPGGMAVHGKRALLVTTQAPGGFTLLRFKLNRGSRAPDADADRVPDKKDSCPLKFGPRKRDGCPRRKP